ncbi:hypothetical protein BDV12DRAFT_191814 [Aspergillus spectabilis]
MAAQSTLLSIFNHVVLPPELPGKSDEQIDAVEGDLIHRFLDVVKAMKTRSQDDLFPTWQIIENTLTSSSLVNDRGICNKAALSKALRKLSPESALTIRIREQNAGLLIRKACDGAMVVIFEAFEISPTAEQTLAAKGALQWDFPGTAVSVPCNVFDDHYFQENLASFLEKASIEPLEQFAVKVRKAGTQISEARNTVDPAIVTQFLMTLLEANGEHVEMPVLRKRVKDDVCWDKAKLPWRRSPFWLTLRVCVQRLLYLHLGSEVGRMQYKAMMCLFLARLLNDCTGELSSENYQLLKVKLCRRLAKLDTEKEDLSITRQAANAYIHVLKQIEPFCARAIDNATAAMKNEWNIWKMESGRRVRKLPSRADPSDFRLTLPNSIAYIREILKPRQHHSSQTKDLDPRLLADITAKSTTEQFAALTKTYSLLADREAEIELNPFATPLTKRELEKECITLASSIMDYIKTVGNAYDGDPEQTSLFILSIFDMWVAMDKCATAAYPLLKDYHPWFRSDIFDILLLIRWRNLKHLQAIQTHLRSRCTQANRGEMTIFADPEPGCFADQYFDSPEAVTLRTLQLLIVESSSDSKERKMRELREINETFDELTEKLKVSSCTLLRNPDGSHDIRGCKHCYYMRYRRRLEIGIHEDFLPMDPESAIQQKAIIFELRIPRALAAYREATWTIVNTLFPVTDCSATARPEMLLADYSPLRMYSCNHNDVCFSLASHTKSFHGTHYRWRRFPAASSDILLPHGLRYSYYDSKRKLWFSDYADELSLAHHFKLRLPKESPFSDLYSSATFAPDGEGPSSYEIVASTSECPSELTIHEWTAHQSLMAGTNRRWLSILAELGSSNINFSLPDTMVLFNHLALQAGPMLKDDGMRAVHSIFRDSEFCNRLAEQISRHVEAIATNWRETIYMETLLTLSLRLFSSGHLDSRANSKRLILRIRKITLNWITLLRNETRHAEDVMKSDRAARYCFLSALLCRRTVFPWLTQQVSFDLESLECFFQASLAMQESLIVDLSKFSTITRNMLVRDIKMAAMMASLLRDGAMEYPTSLGGAIDTVWPSAGSKQRSYEEWKLLSPPYDNWATSTTNASNDDLQQTFYLHILEGHLVVDGQTIGKLPADIRDSEILKELFGSQRLFALPSNIPGMLYALANRAEGHQIHLGYRNEQLVIQARTFRSTLELVPRGVFGTAPSFDLPFTLISECIHWINLQTGVIEIRQKPHIWRRKESNWTIDIRTREAQRKKSTLVDPFSPFAQIISRVFLHFEHAGRLTIHQNFGKLTRVWVDLKLLNLEFCITNGGQLKCMQLGAVVDLDQDPGTFYGLQSMLVLRGLDERSQRSIIVPHGEIRTERHRSHVLVRIDHTGRYTKYTINNVLQRLECPADPELLYTKALLHALTSHMLPDPLTGRTGTQEAFACLQSGQCQPSIPLTHNSNSLRPLMALAGLTPRREYYPKDKQCQQTVSWSLHLTATIQHEGFQGVVDAIIVKSERLAQFNTPTMNPLPKSPANTIYLRERALWRRSIFEAADTLTRQASPPEDIPYVSRDGWSASKPTSNVSEVVTLLRRRPSKLCTTRDLVCMLESWKSIGGYSNTFSFYDIKDFLNANLAEQWGGLIKMCRDSKKEDVYKLMFQLGMLSFREDVDMAAMRVIVSFFLLDELRALRLPRHPSFVGFKEGEEPTADILLPIIRISYQPPWPTKVAKKSKNRVPDENTRFDYEGDCGKEGVGLAELLVQQWPCEEPSVDGFEPKYLNLAEAMETVLPEWERLYQNAQLQRHLTKVQTILNHHYTAAYEEPVSLMHANRAPKEIMGPRQRQGFSYPRIGEILLWKTARNLTRLHTVAVDSISLSNVRESSRHSGANSAIPEDTSPEVIELEDIVHRLERSDCSVRSRYAQDLEQSITALKASKQAPSTGKNHQPSGFREIPNSNENIRVARKYVNIYHRSISESLSFDDTSYTWLLKGSLWPPLTPTTILQQLRSTSQHQFGRGMKELFLSYALAMVKLQKMLRLRDAATKRDEGRLHQEIIDPGHVNWEPSDFPDWVLLEIDANIQIRRDQVTVALEMIYPTSGSNSVLQMNMGQGKTSVIMPMVAAVLANGEMLNRLLVPKALLSQATQLLQSRLGGLLGREIIHIPFSRRTQTTVGIVREYRALHAGTLRNSGIILGIPEHILSFKLSGLQRMVDSKLTDATPMIETQNWMDEVCRDVLDECDFTLAVKTQLIYPGGAQLAVDGHPDRWEVAMTILGLVAHHVRELAREYPQSIDIVERNSTGFPVTHLLRKNVEQALVRRIAEDICRKRTSLLPLGECNEKAKEAIRVFITQEKVEKSVTTRVAKLFPDTPKARKTVYLLRGLLVHGILILCLKKRWNVQYGLHRLRDPIAVPFHAKGVPSDQAEWGHPDVAILFTCLAFYYEGLNKKQLKSSLEAVLKSDHPATEYDRWTYTSPTLPKALRHWNAISVDDEGLVGEIWRHLRFTPTVINHFLSNFVFPLHAKQFATKLQASGWDVILCNNSLYRAAEKSWIHPGVTTGFSGTNDNRRLLPLTIEQCDLPGLSHTNAEVLTYLLQARNRRYRLATGVNGKRLSEDGLLNYLNSEKIRILIDAGAFIMEMDNVTVARTWIEADWSAKGAVYFGEDNKPWIMYRNLKRAPLFASPYADNLDSCVVYLDEAHTRGTDLQLPAGAIGALTLGLSQTKDHTVQAAMRLRQLGTTQSVTFVAPPEVHQSILDVCNKSPSDTLDSSDVITWLLDQTCAANRELQPLYFAQGRDFCQRLQAAATYKKFLSNSDHRRAYLDILRQPEQQTLERLYEPIYGEVAASSSASGTLACVGRVATLMQTLIQRRQETQAFDSIISSALEEVEQEREVAYEIEEEREVQRPRRPKALRYPGLHQSILDFAHGYLLDSSSIIAASEMLEHTQLGKKYKIEGSSLVCHIYLSAEFIRTIKLKKSGEKNDTYTRPVNWIVYNMVTETALVVIPEEAEELIPVMRTGPPNTHLIMYAAPWTKSMLHFNSLDYFALPSLPDGWNPPVWLPFELGILGGRLYFPFSEYEDILSRLYSLSGDPTEETELSSLCAVAKNRLSFLQEWFAIRRQGQDITDTPMGYICQDWPLRSDHPFFSSRSVGPSEETGPGLESLQYSVPSNEEDYYSSDAGADDEVDVGALDVDLIDVDSMDLGSERVSEAEDEIVE